MYARRVESVKGKKMIWGEDGVGWAEHDMSAAHRLPCQHNNVEFFVHALDALAQLLQFIAVPPAHKGPAIALEAGAVAVAIRQRSVMKQARPAVSWVHGLQSGRGGGLVVLVVVVVEAREGPERRLGHRGVDVCARAAVDRHVQVKMNARGETLGARGLVERLCVQRGPGGPGWSEWWSEDLRLYHGGLLEVGSREFGVFGAGAGAIAARLFGSRTFGLVAVVHGAGFEEGWMCACGM